MDLTTNDPRALALAPHLVVVASSTEKSEWLNPETGTTCRLEKNGEYAVLRRAGGARVTPVVAGQIRPDEAAPLLESPESLVARRAAAHAIVAVDAA